MKSRTYIGFLCGFLVMVVVAFLASLNRELLASPFRISSNSTVPAWVAFLGLLLIGFLPSVTALYLQSLKRDLSLRRARRLRRETESLGHRFRRAVDFHADGQWRKAANELEILLTDRPEDFSTLVRYGEVLRNQGKLDEALEIHRRASVLYPHSVSLLYQLAEDYEARAEGEIAQEIRNRILRDFPDHGLQVMRRHRDLALVERDWESATRWQERIETFLKEAGEGDRDRQSQITVGLAYQKGVDLLEKDRPAEASQAFRKLLREEPRFIPAGIMLGEAELLQDNVEGALDAWRSGFRDTHSPIFLERLEDYFIEAEDPARGIETLHRLMALEGSDLLPRFYLGRLYYRLEMPEEALRVLVDLAEAMDGSPTYHYLLGRLHQRNGDSAQALASFQACVLRQGVPTAAFLCSACNSRHHEWSDRCEHCGSWSSIEFDLRAEQLSAADLGLREPTFWGGYGEGEERPSGGRVDAEDRLEIV